MNKFMVLAILPAFVLLRGSADGAGVVQEWNASARLAIQADRLRVNPGWSSRAFAMMNGAIYDSLMSIERTHEPFLVDTLVPSPTSKEAAIAQAAWRIMNHTYPEQGALFDGTRTVQLGAIADGPAKTAGIDLGNTVADAYIAWRTGDGADVLVPYVSGVGPGQWRPDPMNPTQEAWGPAWGTVRPFTMTHGSMFQPPAPPALDSVEYANSFNEVKSLGALNSVTRTAEQTEIALFWAYDREGMGPPPVLYNSMVSEIADQQGNSMMEDARLFAMTMVAQADAGIAAWDAKFDENFWRPIAGIREADTDGNPLTEADPNWVPLGAPGGGVRPDFTPPFPAYVSGHATFGAAVFGMLEEFYGTDAMTFNLTSLEMPGVMRTFDSFSEAAAENARSRIYMGIHWDFDDIQGRALGGNIADRVASLHFAPVPEPSSAVLISCAALMLGLSQRRRK
jgi:hypothetical protein